MSNRRKLMGAAVGALAMILLAGASTVSAAAGDPTKALLQGQWVLTVTVSGYTGSVTTPVPAFPVGHTATIIATFSETCTAPGQCTLTVAGPPGSFGFDSASGLALTGSSSFINGVLAPLGSTNGFGGPGLQNCPPPPLPQFSLTLRVTEAVLDATGDHAVTLTGTQSALVTWCVNGAGLAVPEHQIISIVGHPVGYVPPTPNPTARPTPVPPLTQAPSAPPPATGTLLHPLPNTITSAIAPPDQAFGSPAALAINAAITVVVLLFITFPANLFNRTFDENYDEIKGMVTRRLPWLAVLRRRPDDKAHEQRRHLIVFLVVLMFGAILGGFLDPSFGFNGSSFTTVMSTLLSICFGLLVGTGMTAAYRKLRGRPLSMTPRALPAGLVIAIVCVIISRVSDFHPGYLYGIICGIAFTAPIPKREEAHLVALGSVVTLVLAVIAWFIWVPLHAAAVRPDAGFGVVLFDDFVGALFVGGLVGSVIGLFPLRFLPGSTLVEWNRAVWLAMFGVAVFGLLQLMLRPESSSAHSTKAALITAVVLFVVFGAASVLFSWYFARRHQRAAAVVPAG